MTRIRLACAFLLLLSIACSNAHGAEEPNSAEAYLKRGNTYLDKAEYDKAIKDYSEAIRLDPTLATAYYKRGNAYADKKEFDKAIEDYGDAIRLDPKYAGAYYNRGCVYTDKQEYDKAIKNYTEAIRLKPEYGDAYYNRGCLYGHKSVSKKPAVRSCQGKIGCLHEQDTLSQRPHRPPV